VPKIKRCYADQKPSTRASCSHSGGPAIAASTSSIPLLPISTMTNVSGQRSPHKRSLRSMSCTPADVSGITLHDRPMSMSR